MNGGVALVVEVDPHAHRAAARDALSRRERPTTSTTRSRRVAALDARRRRRARSALRRQRRRRAAGARRARRHARRAHRPDVRARCAQRLRARRPVARRSGARCATATRTSTVARSIAAMAGTCGDARAAGSAARSRSTTATTSARRRCRPASSDAFDIPGFVPEYIRPLFCEGKGPFRWAALSGDPDDIRVTDDAALEMFADDDGAVPLDPPGARARRVPGTAGAHLLARLRRARAVRPAVQRAGARRRGQGADRHRPRSSRHRIGRVAQPRDRRHARRQRRDRRLADPQRAAQRVGRRHLGVGPPRRRRRHRLLAARRHGDRRRRHARGGRAARARADVRPRHRRRAPRRRRLPRGDRTRARRAASGFPMREARSR